jgi:hypothetical protein
MEDANAITHIKQPRYKTNPEDTLDFIDKFFANHSEAEIKGAMAFTVGKYWDRLGKKDCPIAEMKKAHDYTGRYIKHLETLTPEQLKLIY